MTETKWTKAPWEAADRGDYGDFDGNSRVILGDDMRIAVVQHHGSEEDEANAHLIASAPDLYKALARAAEIIRKHVPAEAMGEGGGICPEPGHPDFTWAIKDEELHHIDVALAKARGDHS